MCAYLFVHICMRWFTCLCDMDQPFFPLMIGCFSSRADIESVLLRIKGWDQTTFLNMIHSITGKTSADLFEIL